MIAEPAPFKRFGATASTNSVNNPVQAVRARPSQNSPNQFGKLLAYAWAKRSTTGQRRFPTRSEQRAFTIGLQSVSAPQSSQSHRIPRRSSNNASDFSWSWCAGKSSGIAILIMRQPIHFVATDFRDTADSGSRRHEQLDQPEQKENG